jgi:surface carbohydrate biosynthesis protein
MAQLLRKYLYIPMEIFHRELDGNLLLATAAAKCGWTVILGGKQDVFDGIGKNPRGTYLLKSIVPGEYEIPKLLRENRNVVALHDQEGLLQRPGLEYKFRYSDSTISMTDHLFFWGKQQLRDFLQVFPKSDSKKLNVTGSPRADYWMLLSTSSNRLKSQHVDPQKLQKYVLFATSFGNSNHFLGKTAQKYLLKSVSNHTALSDFERRELDENYENRRELATIMLPLYSEILIKLAKAHPSVNIVVRPHPSEGEDYWRELTYDLKNVIVSSKGTVTEWICGASCLIQYGSSTAVEANLLNVPVVSCIPKTLPKYLEKLHIGYTETASILTDDSTSAVAAVTNIVSKHKEVSRPIPNEFNEILFGLSTFNNASKNIMRVLDNTAIFTAQDLKKHNIFTLVFKRRKLYLLHLLNILLRLPYIMQFIPDKYMHLEKSISYRNRKIFHLDPILVNQKIRDIEKLLDGNLDNIMVRRYSRNCVVLEAK